VVNLECGQFGNPIERAGEECPKCGNREAVRADLCKVFQAATRELRAAMNWMFPVVAKNFTMIHRSPTSWPHVDRLEIK